jgi:hypothetical protein
VASRLRASLLEIDMDPLPMALLIDVGPGVAALGIGLVWFAYR